MNEALILMIDSETTSLNPRIGIAHQLAAHAVLVEPNYRTKIIYSENFLLPTKLVDWDAPTLAWAKQNIPEAVEATLTAGTDSPFDSRKAALSTLKSDLSRLADLTCRKAVVAAHPEFDLPFFENAGIDLRRMFGHRAIFDLNSLLVGRFGNFNRVDRVKKAYRGDHSALGDCLAQMRQLEVAGWCGLPEYLITQDIDTPPFYRPIPTNP